MLRVVAPIVLFVYNRPEHVKKVIESLKKNELYTISDLYIYSDYPKNESARSGVDSVREYIRNISGFKSIEIIEREFNYGLKRNILEGVSSILDKYNKVIVMEDDIEPTPFFLDYLNDALDKYESEDSVMEVSATHEYMDVEGLPESFFIQKGFCHGWATWKRAWDRYDKNLSPKEIIGMFDRHMRKSFNLNGATFEFGEVIDNYVGEINTWAVFWDIAIYLNDGLVLVPRENMACNIGFDGSGEHCPKVGRAINSLAEERLIFYPDDVSENRFAKERYVDGCLKRRPDLLHRVYYSLLMSYKLYFGNRKSKKHVDS